MKSGTSRTSTLVWDSWIEDIFQPNETSEDPPTRVNSYIHSDNADTISLIRKDYKRDTTFPKRDQLFDEPWLSRTLLFSSFQ
ncbi:hypothetical protein SAY87_012187 [Trapa incisa]|uniref:Uncharacterized protein n=1 Tax=Trapa incisa TaxID=236973 RepID=A0AAN7GN34_9MYRT|nr:hypothetical protein SAY87_012187 [Trapa incisa]